MYSKLFLSLALIAVIAVGCSSENPLAPMDNHMDDNAVLSGTVNSGNLDATAKSVPNFLKSEGEIIMFTVRIENVSTGMTLHLSNGETAPAPHSPGVWAVTQLMNPFFKVGQYDFGEGLEQQAEDGNPSVLAGNIAAKPWVKSSGVFNTPVGDGSPGPATPGKAYEFTISAYPGDHFSFTSMFGQSNDLFYSTGMVGVALFRDGMPISGDVTSYFTLWDAGTEVNQEPGLGSDQAPRQSGTNTGESEYKRILRVQDEYTYPATDEVIKVTITPIS